MKKKDKNGVTRKQAYYLCMHCATGAVYLVKDKDGTCWIVDHGAGEIEKRDEHWIDTEGPAWQEQSFAESKYNFDIVSWEDEDPLDIYDYLVENGWMTRDYDIIN